VVGKSQRRDVTFVGLSNNNTKGDTSFCSGSTARPVNDAPRWVQLPIAAPEAINVMVERTMTVSVTLQRSTAGMTDPTDDLAKLPLIRLRSAVVARNVTRTMTVKELTTLVHDVALSPD
jgi:hypothetical protein